jgi:hypothetical protein
MLVVSVHICLSRLTLHKAIPGTYRHHPVRKLRAVVATQGSDDKRLRLKKCQGGSQDRILI